MTQTERAWAAQTAGADLRESARRLQLLADELLAEAAQRESLQSSRSLTDPVGGLRQTLIALASTGVVDPGAAAEDGSVHVLRGTARLVAGESCTELRTHDYAPLPGGAHLLSADGPAVILHSVVSVPTSPPSRSEAPGGPTR